ncbi:MAG: hypothetical protein RIT11_758 [Pseudomonadota bacterium]|jgi:hypothetical protein
MLEHHLACQCQACLEASLDEDMNNYYAELHEDLCEEIFESNEEPEDPCNYTESCKCLDCLIGRLELEAHLDQLREIPEDEDLEDDLPY